MNRSLEISVDTNNLQMVDPPRSIKITPEQMPRGALYILTQSYNLHCCLFPFPNLRIGGAVLGNPRHRLVMQDHQPPEDTRMTQLLERNLAIKEILVHLPGHPEPGPHQ